VLNTYRPLGQTSWSRALVRHGADPQTALAKVLEVSGDDLQVSEAGSEPRANANTAATTVPGIRNTALAGTKLRPAAPSSPLETRSKGVGAT
jgi:hypothetical protein